MGHNAIRENRGGLARVGVYAILLFQLVVIGSLIRGIQVSYKSKERVELLQNKKQQLEEENAKLKADAAYVQSEYYIEKVAREELQRGKPGEKVVILPENMTQFVVSSPDLEKATETEKKNWEKWWALLVE